MDPRIGIGIGIGGACLSVAGAQWAARQLASVFVRSAYVIHIQLRSQFSIVGCKMRNVGAKSAVKESRFMN